MISVRAPLTIALPKGRIWEEAAPLFARVGIIPEAAFTDDASRQLVFATNHPDIRLIRVRSFDVATFVAFGAAQIGICGSDVLEEFDSPELYAPVDLRLGKCRISIAAPEDFTDAKHWRRGSHARVATKYPHITQAYFARAGVQAECVKLNGAMEIAPILGLSRYIVDLVSSGATLVANGLKEIEVMSEVSSRLIVHRPSFKTQSARIEPLIAGFSDAVGD